VRVFDAHLHVVDPRFTLVPNRGYVPGPFTVEDYRRRTAGLGVVGGAVVAGSFQGDDPAPLLDALEALGPGFAGVAQLAPGVPDAEIARLDAAGVRAVRLNLVRGDGPLDGLLRLARRAEAVAGWHAELYVDARELDTLAPRLRGLAQLSIDHLGLSREGLPALLRQVARGAKVKATGFGRLGDLDVPAALRAVAAEDPTALMFGTDLPSTRAPRPFADADAALVREALGPELARLAMLENAAALYGATIA
jgi:predicted TIM-barrel fold metal-dependent hydrolase